MNFDLSEEQQLLKDSVERFVNDNYDLDTRQSLSKNDAGFSDTYWQTMAELGWLGVTVPEAQGGFGGNQADTMVLMEAFGKGLVLEPFFASAVLGTRAIVAGGSSDSCRHGCCRTWSPENADLALPMPKSNLGLI